MKLSLGKLIGLIGIFSVSYLQAATYQWSVLDAPKQLFVQQSGVIRYECVFNDSAAEYTIDFKPKNTQQYSASILTQRDRIVLGKRIQTFDVLITPKQEGVAQIQFDALIRHTTFASIENATIGRDNVKKYDFNDEIVHLPSVSIDSLPSKGNLTGNFELVVEVDKKRVIAHEPLHLSIYLKGKGNLDAYHSYPLKIEGVNVFTEGPLKNITPDASGFSGEVREEFALVATESFIIPSINIEVFDPVSQQIKYLKTKPIAIEVAQGYEPSALIEAPKTNFLVDFISFFKVLGWMILGMIVLELTRWARKKWPQNKSSYLGEDAITLKELIITLSMSGDKKYEAIIEELEKNALTLREAKLKLSTLSTGKKVML